MYQPYVFPFFKKIDFRNIDPEITHTFYLHTLHIAQTQPAIYDLLKRKLEITDPRLRMKAFGLKFKNPVCAAAGFDKNGIAVRALSALGFGAIEAGTVTPLPQYGKKKHRLFRLEHDCALINRFGFSNDGVEHLVHHLKTERKRNYILGLNIGPNANSVEKGKPISDYLKCIKILNKYGDYFTINISSPNTEGLRLLQAKNELDKLLRAIFKEAKKLQIKKPFLVKIAPDLTDKALFEILEVFSSHPVAGIIATNTTLARPRHLVDKQKKEIGGLSGKPLKGNSTRIIRLIYKRTKGKLPIMGVGGIFYASDAIEKIRAGASVVQLYTGFLFEGPSIVRSINMGILRYMKRHRVQSLKELVGTDIRG